MQLKIFNLKEYTIVINEWNGRPFMAQIPKCWSLKNILKFRIFRRNCACGAYTWWLTILNTSWSPWNHGQNGSIWQPCINQYTPSSPLKPIQPPHAVPILHWISPRAPTRPPHAPMPHPPDTAILQPSCTHSSTWYSHEDRLGAKVSQMELIQLGSK